MDLLEGPTKQVLVQGDTLRLLEEAGSRGTRTSGTRSRHGEDMLNHQELRPCPPARTGISGLRPEIGKKGGKTTDFGLPREIGKN